MEFNICNFLLIKVTENNLICITIIIIFIKVINK